MTLPRGEWTPEENATSDICAVNTCERSAAHDINIEVHVFGRIHVCTVRLCESCHRNAFAPPPVPTFIELRPGTVDVCAPNT